MIPITSELFQGVADGSFGAMLGVPSPPLVMGVESADPSAQLGDVDEGSGVLFGDMPGTFTSRLMMRTERSRSEAFEGAGAEPSRDDAFRCARAPRDSVLFAA